MNYSVIKHSRHRRTLQKCRKHSPAARIFLHFLRVRNFLFLLIFLIFFWASLWLLNSSFLLISFSPVFGFHLFGCATKVSHDDSLETMAESTAVSQEHLTANWECVFRWCCLNYFLVNPDKTKALLIGVPQLLNKLSTQYLFGYMVRNLHSSLLLSILAFLLTCH